MKQEAIKVLIADDESSARRRLVDLLAAEPDVLVVGESSNGRQACDDIVRLAPDLVLLDVEMPELDGLEVVSTVGLERMPATIFITAHHRYAVSAFEADAMDYLLKPFDQERFVRALAKARVWMQGARRAERPARLQMALDTLAPTPPFLDRLWVRSGDSRQLLRIADVMYIRAEGNYVRLHTHEGSFALRERMIGMLDRLNPAQFRRVHRSHIVNLDHVKKLLPWFGGDGLLMMSDGSRLTLSRTFRDAFGDFG